MPPSPISAYRSQFDAALAEPSLAPRLDALQQLRSDLDVRAAGPFLSREVDEALEATEQALAERDASLSSSRIHIDAPLVPEAEPCEPGRRMALAAPCVRRGRPPMRRRGAGRPAGRRRLAARGDPGDGEPSDTRSVEEILARAADLVEEHQHRAAEAIEDAEAWRYTAARWRSLTAEVTARLAPGDREAFLRIVEQLTAEGEL